MKIEKMISIQSISMNESRGYMANVLGLDGVIFGDSLEELKAGVILAVQEEVG